MKNREKRTNSRKTLKKEVLISCQKKKKTGKNVVQGRKKDKTSNTQNKTKNQSKQNQRQRTQKEN